MLVDRAICMSPCIPVYPSRHIYSFALPCPPTFPDSDGKPEIRRSDGSASSATTRTSGAASSCPSWRPCSVEGEKQSQFEPVFEVNRKPPPARQTCRLPWRTSSFCSQKRVSFCRLPRQSAGCRCRTRTTLKMLPRFCVNWSSLPKT